MDAAYRVYTMTHAKNFKDFITYVGLCGENLKQ
jgi:hypothetical protein